MGNTHRESGKPKDVSNTNGFKSIAIKELFTTSTMSGYHYPLFIYNFITMKTFSELKKNLKNDFSNLIPVKVALLGDSPTQLLAIALRGTGFDTGLDLQIWEAGFDQIERQIFDQASEFYAYKPDVVIIFHSSHQLLQKYNKLKPEDYSSLAEERLKQVENLTVSINSGLSAKIIYYNYPEINDTVFGSYANKTQSSFLYQTRKLNYGLMEFATNNAGFCICDLAAIQNQYGKATLFQPSVYQYRNGFKHRYFTRSCRTYCGGYRCHVRQN